MNMSTALYDALGEVTSSGLYDHRNKVIVVRGTEAIMELFEQELADGMLFTGGAVKPFIKKHQQPVGSEIDAATIVGALQQR